MEDNNLLGIIQKSDVEWKLLGEVADYSKLRIDASKLTEHNYVGVDNLLQNLKGKTLSNYVPSEGKLTRFDAGDVLVGNIRPYLKKTWLSDLTGGTNGDVLVIRLNEEYSTKILPKYLYQVLVSERFFNYDMQHSKGAKMPRGDKAEILKFEIPIPPLEIQEKCVEILDKMTEMVQELTAELTLRNQQYAYYRDLLLSESELAKVGFEWQTLGEVCQIFAGGDLPENYSKGQDKPTEEFPYPIFSNGTAKQSLYGYTDGYRIEKESVTISARGTLGWHAIREPKFTPIVRLLTIIPDLEILSTKYLNYILTQVELG